MRFASFNVEVSGKHRVREGYHEFPVCVPRWMKIPGGSYGIGPVYDALPDCKELNETKRMEKAAQDLAISGCGLLKMTAYSTRARSKSARAASS
jgi:hypothetical protein